MLHINRLPDYREVLYETDVQDGTLRLEEEEGEVRVYLRAPKGEPRFIKLRWNEKTREPVSILGDKWARSGNLSFTGIIADLAMPSFFPAEYLSGDTPLSMHWYGEDGTEYRPSSPFFG